MREILRLAALIGCSAMLLEARAASPNPADMTEGKPATGAHVILRVRVFEWPKPNALPSLRINQSSILRPTPSDDIQTLETFFVFGQPALPKEKDMLTDYGRLQIAKRKYTSELYRGTFGPLSQLAAYYFNFLAIAGGWHPNDAEAMTLYRESERVQVLNDFDDLSRLEKFRDPTKAKELRLMRQELWRTGLDSLYWNTTGPTGILIGGKKR